MALVATVLLVVLAATIVLVISAQAINTSHDESSSADLAAATLQAHNAAAAFESALETNPYFFYAQVFTATVGSSTYSEQARLCDQGSTVVQPGGAWSLASCGAAWTYRAPIVTPTAWLRITPPHLDSPVLTVNIMATVGSTSDGLTLTFRMNGTENYTLFSSSALDLTTLPGTPTLSGPVYTPSTITVPNASSPNATSLLGAAQLEAEQGFPTAPIDPSARYYAATASSSAVPPIYSIRNVVPEVLTTQSMRASFSDSYAVACPGGTPWYDTFASASSSLCLKAGSTIVTSSSGTTVIVPAAATAYMLNFATSGPNVAIWYTTRTNPLMIDTSCAASACDLATDSSAGGPSDVAAGTHPGQLSSWTYLATVPLPETGIIFTDHDVQLGICSTGSDTPFLTPGGSCPSLSAGSTDAGMDVAHSLTVLAGTPTTPANVWIGTSIFTTNNASFGAIATGQLFIPYWSHSPYSTATAPTTDPTANATTQVLDGAYAAMGYGIDPSLVSPIAPWPQSQQLYTSASQNLASSLVLNGSLAAPDLSIGTPITAPAATVGPFAAFANVTLANQSQFVTAPPPYFTDFDGTWSLVATTRYTVAQACGINVLSC
jgi:hypothetical protein